MQTVGKYWSQIIETLGEAVSISDPDGIILYSNRRHEELTGIPGDELMGKSVHELVRRGLFDVVLNPGILRSKQPETQVQELASGHKLVLDGHPVFDEKGNVALVITYLRDVTKLSEMREQLMSQQELLKAYQKMQSLDMTMDDMPTMVQSKAMKQLFGQLSIIAETDATVLLLGETGVGKDVFARRLHRLSDRSDKAFIKADCGSMPKNLIETELFGYAPGTFSGGNKGGKIGLIEAASGGTLFLDEIGELPLLMQTKLLRLLQDREIVRVGATTPLKVNVRIVAATNKNLKKEVEAGRFRSDLYYRLKVAVIEIPPLRKRKADILSLARLFLKFFSQKYRRDVTFSQEAENALLNHNWPGNVRELENLVLGCVVTSKKNVIELSDLPFATTAEVRLSAGEGTNGMEVTGKSMKEILDGVEKSIILRGMERVGNIAKLAKELQLDRTTVFRKLKKYEAE
ncbi:sigma-54 interaction domain-containing protein [Pseudodesulfovibrio mercurii]|uniref:sigma-54 interaction domain-containing protein n=1 Tax=Pseudodesulfovibrio mercurii TaxID=641491 RepID=UPI001EE636FF|nr:sigma 54-interacting transcriptional regulator [Pseudodesulfovibrio mercurii]